MKIQFAIFVLVFSLTGCSALVVRAPDFRDSISPMDANVSTYEGLREAIKLPPSQEYAFEVSTAVSKIQPAVTYSGIEWRSLVTSVAMSDATIVTGANEREPSDAFIRRNNSRYGPNCDHSCWTKIYQLVSDRGFGRKCECGWCAFDFLAVSNGSSYFVVDSTSSLRKFLGKTDTPVEAAMLVFSVTSYWPETVTPADNGYKVTIIEKVLDCAPTRFDRVFYTVSENGKVRKSGREMLILDEKFCACCG